MGSRSSRLIQFLLVVFIKHIIVHDLALFPHLQLLIGGTSNQNTDRSFIKKNYSNALKGIYDSL